MKIKSMSDLHLEFDNNFVIPQSPDDKETTLVLAGDICVVRRHYIIRPFLQKCASQFKHVVWVLGNHEFYHESLFHVKRKAVQMVSDLDNVHYLSGDYVELDGVLFIGATLWTDFQRGNAILMNDAQMTMNDYRCIRLGPSLFTKGVTYRKITADDILLQHRAELRFIKDTLTRYADREKIVIVTHHAPSWRSITPNFITNRMNGCYVSDLDYLMYDYENIVAWFHGHIHSNSDYMINKTRVVSNPRGYIPEEPNLDFNLNKVIEI